MKPTWVTAILLAVAASLLGVPAMAAEGEDHPAEIYLEMRQMALGLTASELGLAAQTANQPYGILMEIDFDGVTVTLASFASGDASLYFSNGGGLIGSGQASEEVADAAKRFVAAAGPYVRSMAKTAEQPLPSAGQVTFHVLTPAGVYTATRPEEELGEERDALSPLFYAGQDVLTEIRLLQERQEAEGE